MSHTKFFFYHLKGISFLNNHHMRMNLACYGLHARFSIIIVWRAFILSISFDLPALYRSRTWIQAAMLIFCQSRQPNSSTVFYRTCWTRKSFFHPTAFVRCQSTTASILIHLSWMASPMKWITCLESRILTCLEAIVTGEDQFGCVVSKSSCMSFWNGSHTSAIYNCAMISYECDWTPITTAAALCRTVAIGCRTYRLSVLTRSKLKWASELLFVPVL
jgi:hypothetical protein